MLDDDDDEVMMDILSRLFIYFISFHLIPFTSTLQFADRAKSVMLSVKANTLVDDKFLLTKAHAEINRLKGLLAQALKQNEGRLKQPIDSMSGITIADYQQLQDENENLKKDLMLLKSLIDSRASNHHGSIDNDHYINDHHHHDSIVNQSNRYEHLNNRNTNNNNIITASTSASASVVDHNINPLLSQYSSSNALVHNSSMMIDNINNNSGSDNNTHHSYIASKTNTSIDQSHHHTSVLPSITSVHPALSVPSLSSSSFSNTDNNGILHNSQQQVKLGNQKAKPPQVGKNFWDLERFSYFGKGEGSIDRWMGSKLLLLLRQYLLLMVLL